MNSPTLDYANPPVFFAGVDRHRDLGSVVVMVSFTLLGILAVWALLSVPVADRFRFPAAGLIPAAGCFLLGAAQLAVGVITGREDVVRVTGDGISYRRRFWPWGRITRFGGIRYGSHDVMLEVWVRRAVVPLPRPQLLPTVPYLTADQFARLAAEVRAYLSRHHPRVRVDSQPRSSD